jgi:hypothetical protein
MKKLVRDGRVAVLVRSRHGGGWYSWHRIEELLYDPTVVEWLEQGKITSIQSYLALKYQDEYISGQLDLDGLEVQWVPAGVRFRINEYDGTENIVLESQERWLTA